MEHILQEIKHFFTRISAEQWASITSGSPDSASKILSMELILTLILNVTEVLFQELNSEKEFTPGQTVLSFIEDSLLLNLAGALGLSSNNNSLRVLSKMINQIIQTNATNFLKQVHVSNINLEISSLTKLERIHDQLIKVFIEMGKENPLLPKKHKKRKEHLKKWEKLSNMNEDKMTTSIQHEKAKHLSDIINCLLVDTSKCSMKRIRSESYLELHNAIREPSTLHDFYSKWFLKVWLLRMVQRLQTKYPHETKEGTLEIIDSIIEGLISASVVVENQETANVNSLLMMFRKFPCDNLLELTENLSDLIFQCLLMEQDLESTWEKQVQWKLSDPEPRSGIDIDVWRHVCVCIVIMNWFHNSLVENMVVPQIRDTVQPELTWSTPEHKFANQVAPECEEDTELQNLSKVYVKIFLAKAVYHIYHEAKVGSRNRDREIDNLFQRIWPEVKGQKIYVTDRTFQRFDRAIHCGLCRKKTLVEIRHYVNTLDPFVVNFLISFIRKRLMTLPQEQHPLKRFFLTLCKKV